MLKTIEFVCVNMFFTLSYSDSVSLVIVAVLILVFSRPAAVRELRTMQQCPVAELTTTALLAAAHNWACTAHTMK